MNIQNPEQVVESPELEQEEAALLSYWTEERMAAAEPLPFSVPAESIDDAQFSNLQPEESLSGEPQAPEGGLFLPRPKFSTSLVKDMNVFPYQCVGKLFMTFGGGDRVASAYVIGESTIGTAGHCLYKKEEKWAENVLFAARYDRSSYVGKWSIKRKGILEGWEKTQNWAYDMAFGIAHRPIRPTTGKLGWMARYPVDQDPYTQIGYPARSIPGYSFNGKRMWKTKANYISHTKSGGTPMVIRAGGNMTGGCSGGPWAVFKDGYWRVNGVSSHRIRGNLYYLHSPYFGQGFVNLIEWMKENGGD